MFYFIATKRGIGVELWGTYEDLSNLYVLAGKFSAEDNNFAQSDAANRNELLSSFSYELRKAKEGKRLVAEKSHFSFDEQRYFGFQVSWVYLLFVITAWRYNMSLVAADKFDLAHFMLVEYWAERAMNTYDPIGATDLVGYLYGALYGANTYIYQYMRRINLNYYLLGGGKPAFRKLATLLKMGVFATPEYLNYKDHLEAEAYQLRCNAHELELDDEHIDYDYIKW